MKQITRLMIDEFNINQLGYDFMGFSLQKGDIYTFHHLLIPARRGGKMVRNNGAILCGKTSHEYLHRIEDINYDIFRFITTEMVEMNVKGYLDKKNLKNIDDLLRCFERMYGELKTKSGKNLIKDEYRRRNKF